MICRNPFDFYSFKDILLSEFSSFILFYYNAAKILRLTATVPVSLDSFKLKLSFGGLKGYGPTN
jgi:hypothetical protein